MVGLVSNQNRPNFVSVEFLTNKENLIKPLIGFLIDFLQVWYVICTSLNLVTGRFSRLGDVSKKLTASSTHARKEKKSGHWHRSSRFISIRPSC